MTRIRLKTVTRTQGNNRAVTDGTVVPEGYAFEFEDVPVLVDGFRRMVRGNEFDVCEMAITTYLAARAQRKPFTALPIFLVRGFHHGAIQVHRHAGITEPKDLQGRRVGVNRGYTVTTGVWARGILERQYGVDLREVTWVRSADEHVAEYQVPTNVERTDDGKTLVAMLLAGELDAVIGADIDHPDVVPLIPNAAEAGFEALRDSGHYPINHLVVVKDELLALRPDLAASVFEAFSEAKRQYVGQLRAGTLATPTAVDVTYRRVMDITGPDPLPYGIEPNRAVLDELIGHAISQRILRHPPTVDSLFAEGTHGLTG